MPLRFRRSISLAPGLKINLGKRGASLSVGGRGAHVTLGGGQVRETVSLPGTGLSYTHTSHRTAAKAPGPAQPAMPVEPMQDEPLPVGVAWRGWAWIFIALLIVAGIIVRAIR